MDLFEGIIACYIPELWTDDESTISLTVYFRILLHSCERVRTITWHTTDITWPFPTKIALSLAFVQFYCTLSRRCHPVATKSQVHKALYEILSIESLITELVGPLVLHNSKDVSTKPLQHLVSIGTLEIPRGHMIVEQA
jgi:hypothetical protein